MHDRIIETIKSTIAGYDLSNQEGGMWKDPIIEIIPAEADKIKMLKEIVSPEHFMPHDILPDAKSIIVFFLPFKENIIDSNNNGTTASKEWVNAYIKTNNLIKKINDDIEFLMMQNGYKAGKIPATHNFDVNKLISNWSHRHIAYLAGMGTFGINNMLITKNGCCGRFGSIIINYKFNEYKEINIPKEKCLNKKNGSCGICQKKCVTNAYENGKFNRFNCHKQCMENGEHYKYLGHADVCGKCVVGLPCSTREP
jgi:epoxyqueuosine reductase QueG